MEVENFLLLGAKSSKSAIQSRSTERQKAERPGGRWANLLNGSGGRNLRLDSLILRYFLIARSNSVNTHT